MKKMMKKLTNMAESIVANVLNTRRILIMKKMMKKLTNMAESIVANVLKDLERLQELNVVVWMPSFA